MGFFSKAEAQAQQKIAQEIHDHAAKHGDSLLRRMQSTIIFVIVFAVICTVIFLTWKVTKAISQGIKDAFEEKNINLSRSSASIGVNTRSQQSIIDSAQQYVYKAWENSQTPEDANVSRMFKLKEWKDRKRHVYQGSGTEAANAGW